MSEMKKRRRHTIHFGTKSVDSVSAIEMLHEITPYKLTIGTGMPFGCCQLSMFQLLVTGEQLVR